MVPPASFTACVVRVLPLFVFAEAAGVVSTFSDRQPASSSYKPQLWLPYVHGRHGLSIYDAYTNYSDVSSFPVLDVSATGPTYQLDYSIRESYQPIGGWPASEPLNATYWHLVTEAMLADHSLVNTFKTFEGKSSVTSLNCTNTACAEAKVCFTRSGSAALGKSCPQKFSSVQSISTRKNF